MHVTLSHLIASVLLLTVMVSTVSATSIFASNYFTKIRTEQLDSEAEKVFDKMLLTQGFPTDWGSNIAIDSSGITDFGLTRENARRLYDLSIDKVSRLTNVSGSNSFYTPPSRVAELIGLYKDQHPEYGFRLRIMQALNISIAPNGLSHDQIPYGFNITVSNYLGQSVPNAAITAFCILINIDQQDHVEVAWGKASNTTDILGKCSLSFQDFIEGYSFGQSKKCAILLSVYADLLGIKCLATYTPGGGDVLFTTMIGRYIIAKFPDDIAPQGARHVQDKAAVITSTPEVILVPVENVTGGEAGSIINHGAKRYQVFEMGSIPDAESNLVTMLVKWTGSMYFTLVSSRPSLLVLDYQTGPPPGLMQHSSYRLLQIGSLTYNAELTFWRMVE